MQKFRYILVTFFTFVSLLILPINVNYASLATDLNEQQAFILSAKIKNDQLNLDWLIDPNSYLYQDKLEVIEKNSDQNLLNARNLPPAIKKHDNIPGDFYVYQDNLNVKLDLSPDNTGNIQSLLVKYQGCSKNSFCYPPVTKQINYTSNKILSITEPNLTINGNQQLSSITLFNLISFYFLGILLAFTPCILPMLPIGLHMLIGSHEIKDFKNRKSLIMVGLYVFSMSAIYAIAGVIAGKIGYSLQAQLQRPSILYAFAILLVLLAFSQFNIFSFTIFKNLNKHLHKLDKKLPKGRYLSAFSMGAISALIVSPCVTPALIGILTYISHQGNPIIGGGALFTFGLGMGTPLIIIAMLGTKFLPKAGYWMSYIKYATGILLLALSVWITSRAIAVTADATTDKTIFIIVTNTLGLSNNITTASKYKKPVLIYFSAKWCISCNKIEQILFNNQEVLQAVKQFTLIKVDLTNMNAITSKKILEQYQIFAPPTFIFLNRSGIELKNYRIIGEIEPQEFIKLLRSLLNSVK